MRADSPTSPSSSRPRCASRLPPAASTAALFHKRTIRDADVRGKRVLVRVDFNVPLENGKVADDTRIRAALPTLSALIEGGASIGLVSHLGRPKGNDAKLSLAPIAKRLAEITQREVPLLDDSVGPAIANAVRSSEPCD